MIRALCRAQVGWVAKLTIDFYSVRDDQNQVLDIGAALLQLGTRPLRERLVARGPLYDDVLLDSHQTHDVILVHLARVRREGIPGKFNRTDGGFGDLNLDRDEDVAEDLHVVFDPQLETMAIQRNGHFRSSSVEQLLSDLLGYGIILEPKLRPDVMAKLTRIQRVGSIRMNITAGMNDPALTGVLDSVGGMIQGVNQHGSMAGFDLTLKMTRGKHVEQDLNYFQRMIAALSHSGRARNLEARVLLAGEEKTEVIDFLRDRLVHYGEVEASGKRLDGDQCKQLLRAALHQHRDLLERLRQNPPGQT
jgi:hypothetical protein